MNRTSKTLALVTCLLTLSSFFVGCAGVKPWERGVLAEPTMQVDPYPIETMMNEHIYFSKEAATGGNSLGGGGCGCN